MTTIYHAGQMVFFMLAGHAYADFALQTPRTSAAKYPGNNTGVPWFVGMGYHALIHGACVALATGFWLLGVAETVSHFAIDSIKGRGWMTNEADQCAHVVCKFIWMIIAINCC